MCDALNSYLQKSAQLATEFLALISDRNIHTFFQHLFTSIEEVKSKENVALRLFCTCSTVGFSIQPSLDSGVIN